MKPPISPCAISKCVWLRALRLKLLDVQATHLFLPTFWVSGRTVWCAGGAVSSAGGSHDGSPVHGAYLPAPPVPRLRRLGGEHQGELPLPYQGGMKRVTWDVTSATDAYHPYSWSYTVMYVFLYFNVHIQKKKIVHYFDQFSRSRGL